ncbi:MAG: hypothetical protein CVV30_06750 [Methanomicrobiales archaeon HGW-Methanomicrobiales-1]|nr:MAG: hypothetical protein CVV30_06750 [Methanomicrobiales archaeon HGW-Methanomicrobiales-1]
MPGLDGTGPQGNSPIIGRGIGRCRITPVLTQELTVASQPSHNENIPAISPGSAQAVPVYGRRRGGVPCGCGHGFGGNRRPKG